MKLRSYQQEAVDAVRAAFADGADSAVLSMATGCHARGQAMRVFGGGSRLVEDVVVGDLLLGPDLRPRRVLSLHRGRQQMVRVVPSLGAPFVVNLDHVQTVYPAQDRDLDGYAVRGCEARVEDWTIREIMRRRSDGEEVGLLLVAVTPGTFLLESFDLQALDEDDYFGFTLDEDGRFLLADGTVSHNSGKSVVFRSIAEGAAAKGNRSMLIVGGTELVKQAASHFTRSGLSVGVEMAGQRSRGDEQVVVASISSLVRRLDRFDPDEFALIQADESHHCMAVSWLRTLAHFGFAVPRVDEKGNICEEKTTRRGSARLVGYTATPDRGDKRDIMQIFDVVAYEYGIEQAIDDGYLVPIRQELCQLDGLDLSKVRKTAGDLSAADLADVLVPLLEPMARHISEVAGTEPTIIYSPLVDLAHQMTDILRKVDGRRTETVDGSTDSETRRRLFADFMAGALPRLSSVGVLTEGVDLPAARVAAVCRMTMVRALYQQIVGRVLRLPPGVDQYETAEERKAAIARSSKPHAIVLDFAGNAGKHKLCRVVDLFTDDLPDGVAALAEAKLDACGGDPQLAVAEALAEVRKMEEAIRGKEIRKILVDPFSLIDIPRKTDPWGQRATDAQLSAIVRAGIVPAKRGKTATENEVNFQAAVEKARKLFDYNNASLAISRIVDRSSGDLATIKQIRLLMQRGVPHAKAMGMTFRDAGEAIDQLERAGWRPTSAWLDRWAR